MTVTVNAPSTRTVAPFVVSVWAEPGSTVIALRGQCDTAALPNLVDVVCRIIADHDGTVMLDLAETSSIDISAIGALARARQFLDDRGRRLILRSTSGLTSQTMDALELYRLVELHGT